MWKLGLGPSVETGLEVSVKSGLRNWCGNWTWGLVEIGLGGAVWKLSLSLV